MATQTFAAHELRAESASSQNTPSSTRLYRPELDILRFFAFFGVFLAHGIQIDASNGILRHHKHLASLLTTSQRIGGFGLSVFFLLSSFLITTLLLAERQKTGTLHLQRFYVRRMLRIWPLYFGAIAACLVFGHWWSPAHLSFGCAAAMSLMASNWYILTWGMLPPVLVALWSISVEEQFYLLWPPLVQRMSTRGIELFCYAVLVFSFGCTGFLASKGWSFFHLWFNSACEISLFAAGVLMALRFGLAPQQSSAAKTLGGTALAFVCFGGADAIVGADPTTTIAAYQAVLCFALLAAGASILLWAFLHWPRALIHRALVYLGRISYGLYVFHMLALTICREYPGRRLPANGWLLVALLLTVICAVLSYEFFEKPFLRLKYRFEVIHSRAA